ncbi:unnamed protein product [Mortierella alpina]
MEDKMPEISRDEVLAFDDVCNIWYKMMLEDMGSHPDADESTRRWLEELANKDYPTSPWQPDQLRRFGHTVCFDGTHVVFGKNTHLFTFVANNRETALGAPVVFLLRHLALLRYSHF